MDLFTCDGMRVLQTHAYAQSRFCSAYEDLETAIQLKQRSKATKEANSLDAILHQIADDVKKLERRIAYSTST